MQKLHVRAQKAVHDLAALRMVHVHTVVLPVHTQTHVTVNTLVVAVHRRAQHVLVVLVILAHPLAHAPVVR